MEGEEGAGLGRRRGGAVLQAQRGLTHRGQESPVGVVLNQGEMTGAFSSDSLSSWRGNRPGQQEGHFAGAGDPEKHVPSTLPAAGLQVLPRRGSGQYVSMSTALDDCRKGTRKHHGKERMGAMVTLTRGPSCIPRGREVRTHCLEEVTWNLRPEESQTLGE